MYNRLIEYSIYIEINTNLLYIDKYLERRQLIKDKAYSGGALIESNLFGLD